MGEGERVTIRGSHQRLFCGFDSHWLASDGHFPHPSSFRRYSPPSYLYPLSPSPSRPVAWNQNSASSAPLSRSPPRCATCRGKVFHPDSCLVHFRGFSPSSRPGCYLRSLGERALYVPMIRSARFFAGNGKQRSRNVFIRGGAKLSSRSPIFAIRYFRRFDPRCLRFSLELRAIPRDNPRRKALR